MKNDNFFESFRRMAKKGVFPHQFAFTLLIPLRNLFLSPKKLLQRLKLKSDDHVLEVGPGPGYFSVQIARAIPAGKLTLTDIQKEMLEIAKKRLNKREITNVEYHVCNGIDFPFADHQFNVIFMVTVLGEVEHKRKYVQEFYRMLVPGGIVSISEQAGDSDKMSIEEMKELFINSGFTFDQLYGTERNFTIHFRKQGH